MSVLRVCDEVCAPRFCGVDDVDEFGEPDTHELGISMETVRPVPEPPLPVPTVDTLMTDWPDVRETAEAPGTELVDAFAPRVVP